MLKWLLRIVHYMRGFHAREFTEFRILNDSYVPISHCRCGATRVHGRQKDTKNEFRHTWSAREEEYPIYSV